MAALQRALSLLTLLTVAACGGKSGPEDPAIAVGTGIPMGAPNATGVRFEAPAFHGTPIDDSMDAPIPLPKALPTPGPTPLPPAALDPFDPQGAPTFGPKPLPKLPKPPKKGMQL